MQTSAECSNRALAGALAKLAVPIVLQNLISAVVNAADVFMLTGVGQDALSAVSLAGQVAFVLTLFYMGLSSGASILGAQYWGRRDGDTVEAVLGLSVRYSMAVSMLFFLATLLAPELLMRIFTPDAALISLGAGYLRILGVGFLFMGASHMLLAIFKSMEQTKLSASISTACLLANIALNALAIFVLFPGNPRMAVLGVAAATSLSRLLELALCLAAVRRGRSVPLKLRRVMHCPTQLRKDFLRCMLPVLGNYLVWGCGLSANSAIMGHIGSDMVSAHSLANTLRNLVTVSCSGMASGGGILLGLYLGKGDYGTARRLGRLLSWGSLLAGALAGLILAAIRGPYLAFSRLTGDAHALLGQMLWVNAVYCIGKSFNMCMVSGVFSAGGDTKFGLICDGVTMWGIILPLGLLTAFALHWPPIAVYLVLCADEFVKLPAVLHHFRQYRWLVNLTREKTQKP